jgi:hypothetical protein
MDPDTFLWPDDITNKKNIFHQGIFSIRHITRTIKSDWSFLLICHIAICHHIAQLINTTVLPSQAINTTIKSPGTAYTKSIIQHVSPTGCCISYTYVMSLHSVNQVFHIQSLNPMNCGNTIQSISQSHSTFIPNQLCFPLMLLLSPLSPHVAWHFCIKQTLTLSHPTQDYCVIKTQQT